MTSAKIRLLILSVGSLAAQRLVAALGTRRERCAVIGANSVADSAGNFVCDAAYLVPPASAGEAYIDRVSAIIREEKPHLVVPTRDDDVVALATLRARMAGAEAVLLTGTAEIARILHDKLESARFAGRHGLPFAPTAAGAAGALDLVREHGLPLVGKPRTGFGTRGVVMLRSKAEIERAFALRPDLVAQPYLDPPPDMAELIAPFDAGLPFVFSFPETRQYFVQVVIGPDGKTSQPFATLSTQFGGHAVRTERCDDAVLLDLGRAYARAAAREGWQGPLNVQLKRTGAHAYAAHDLNGRFSGGTAARAMMGFDEPREVITRFLPGVAFPALPPRPEVDLGQNYLASFPIPRAGLAALRAAGKWVKES